MIDGRGIDRAATLLGAVALVLLVGVGGLAVARDAPSGPGPAPARASEPASWSRSRDDVYYEGPAGRPLVALVAPRLYDAGYCPGSGPLSARALAGDVRATRGADVRAVHRRLTRRLVVGIAGRRTTSPPGRSTVLADGATALRSTVRVRPAPGRCRPAAVALDVVSFAASVGRPRVRTWVLIRDLGPGSLGDAAAERLVQSLRSRT